MPDVNESKQNLDLTNKNISISNEDIAKSLKNMDSDISKYISDKSKEYEVNVDGLDIPLQIQKISLAAAKKGKTSDIDDNIVENVKNKLALYYETSVEYANRKYGEVVEQISQLKKEIDDKLEQKNKLTGEKEKNSEQITDLFDKLKESQKEVSQAQKELDDVNSQIDSFDSDNKYKKWSPEDLDKRNNLIDSLNDKKAKFESLSEKNKNFSEQIVALKNKNAEIDKTIEGMKDIDAKAKQVQDLEEKYSEYFKADKEKTESLKKELNDKGIKVTGELKDQFIDISSGKKDGKEDVQQVPRENKQKSSDNQRMRNEATVNSAPSQVKQEDQPKQEEKNLPIENPKEKIVNFLNMPENDQKRLGIDSIAPAIIQLGLSGDKLNHSQKKQLDGLGKKYEDEFSKIAVGQNPKDVENMVNSLFKTSDKDKLDTMNELFNLQSVDNVTNSYKYMDDKARKEINLALKDYYEHKKDMDPKDVENIENNFVKPLKYTAVRDSINKKSMNSLVYKVMENYNAKGSKFYSKDSKNYSKDLDELSKMFAKDSEKSKELEKKDDFRENLKNGVDSKTNSKYSKREEPSAEKER